MMKVNCKWSTKILDPSTYFNEISKEWEWKEKKKMARVFVSSQVIMPYLSKMDAFHFISARIRARFGSPRNVYHFQPRWSVWAQKKVAGYFQPHDGIHHGHELTDFYFKSKRTIGMPSFSFALPTFWIHFWVQATRETFRKIVTPECYSESPMLHGGHFHKWLDRKLALESDMMTMNY